jgi:hypothetical protein
MENGLRYDDRHRGDQDWLWTSIRVRNELYMAAKNHINCSCIAAVPLMQVPRLASPLQNSGLESGTVPNATPVPGSHQVLPCRNEQLLLFGPCLLIADKSRSGRCCGRRIRIRAIHAISILDELTGLAAETDALR